MVYVFEWQSDGSGVDFCPFATRKEASDYIRGLGAKQWRAVEGLELVLGLIGPTIPEPPEEPGEVTS